MEKAVVTGGFDDIRCSDIRFLEEASRQGKLHVFLWSDQLVRSLDGLSPKFSQGERMYFLQAIRYVNQIHLVDQLADRDSLPLQVERYSGTWVVNESNDNHQKRVFCASNGLKYQVVKQAILKEFPKFQIDALENRSQNKKVIVSRTRNSACYWAGGNSPQAKRPSGNHGSFDGGPLYQGYRKIPPGVGSCPISSR
jgi:glycerol-3-phosphate cytidylyltransferase-like family protein